MLLDRSTDLVASRSRCRLFEEDPMASKDKARKPTKRKAAHTLKEKRKAKREKRNPDNRTHIVD